MKQWITWNLAENRGIISLTDRRKGLGERVAGGRIDEINTNPEALLHLQGVYVRKAQLQGPETGTPGCYCTKEREDGCHPALKEKRVLLLNLQNLGQGSTSFGRP